MAEEQAGAVSEDTPQTMTVAQRSFLLGVVVVAGVLVYLLGPVLTPFLVSLVLAYLGDPIADRLERLGLGRTGAVCVVFFVVALLFILALLVVIPGAVKQIRHVIELLPALGHWLQMTVVPRLAQYVDVSPDIFNLKDLSARLSGEWQQTGNLLKHVSEAIGGSTKAMVAFLTNLFLIPVVTFYLLRDWDRLLDNIGQLIPRNLAPTVNTLATECNGVLGAFMKGQLLVMLLLGITYGTGLWFVGLNFALLVRLACGGGQYCAVYGIYCWYWGCVDHGGVPV